MEEQASLPAIRYVRLNWVDERYAEAPILAG
jgi:hypothetical protein